MPGHKFQIVEISVYFTNIWERRQFLFWRCLHRLQVKILYRKTNTRLSWERGYLEKYRRIKKEIMVRFDEENTEATNRGAFFA